MTTSLNNIYIGLVVNNKDPKQKGSVQVYIPHLTNTLYSGWNESNKNIRFRTLDSDVFTPEITQRLIDVLPWAEVAMPFFGGGTGAPVDNNNNPTPIPTEVESESDTLYLNLDGESPSTPTDEIPLENLNTPDPNRTNVANLNSSVYNNATHFLSNFPDARISGAAESTGHSAGSAHYPDNNKNESGPYAKGGLALDISALDKNKNPITDQTKAAYLNWFANQPGVSKIYWEGDHLHVGWPRSADEVTDKPEIKSLVSEPKWFTIAKNNIESEKLAQKANGINNRQGTLSSEIERIDFETPLPEMQPSTDPIVVTKPPELVPRICTDFNGSSGDGSSYIGNAGSSIGFISAPQVGAKAYVMFLDGNHLSPIVIGAFIEPSNTYI